MFMVYSGNDVMSLSIEEQAKKYAESQIKRSSAERITMSSAELRRFMYYAHKDGAKARDDQWSAVVSELRESIKQFYKAAQRIDKFGYGVNIESNQVITNTEDSLVEACATGVQAITKADQLLKEMGMKL